MLRFCVLLLSLGFAQMMGLHQAMAKGVVVSIHPLYLIAQDVLKGVESPTLLLSPQQAGHDIQLTPKNRQSIHEAALILWLGSQHEVALAQPLAQQKNAIAMLDSGILKTLPLRNLNGQVVSADSIDSHVWLEPNNAVRIAFLIAALRSQQMPQYKAQYFSNAQQFAQRLYEANKTLALTDTVHPYWAYHDAYQYLERALQLKFVGALTTDHELPPTLTQIKYLNDHRPQHQMCLLAESKINAALEQKLNPIKYVVIDEAMAQYSDFVQAWLDSAKQVKQCVE